MPPHPDRAPAKCFLRVCLPATVAGVVQGPGDRTLIKRLAFVPSSAESKFNPPPSPAFSLTTDTLRWEYGGVPYASASARLHLGINVRAIPLRAFQPVDVFDIQLILDVSQLHLQHVPVRHSLRGWDVMSRKMSARDAGMKDTNLADGANCVEGCTRCHSARRRSGDIRHYHPRATFSNANSNSLYD